MVTAKFTFAERIKSYIAFYAFKVYLWACDQTEQEFADMYREQIIYEMKEAKTDWLYQ